MDGFLCIDKPAGLTTFDVVRGTKTLLHERHAGHAGTLDPAATGVVVIALGKCTRLIQYLPLEPKDYEFTVRFGVETDTMDDTGRETARSEIVPSEDDVRGALERFRGAVTQVPPRFSAVKIDGVRAYTRARRDEQFETRPREVHIFGLELTSYDAGLAHARCRVSCSAGTYVRTLASDIGLALGSRAHAAGIRRTAAGRFTLAGASPFDVTPAQLVAAVIPAYRAFAGTPRPCLDAGQLRELSHGRRVRLAEERTQTPIVAFDTDNRPAAVLRRQADGWFQPLRVFVSLEEAGAKA